MNIRLGSPCLAWLVLGILTPHPAAGQTANPSRNQPAIEERVDIRLIQVDVSVIDPKAGSVASISGLTLDHFDIRIDGRKLTAEERRRVLFDPVCDALPDRPAPAGGPAAEPPPRPVLAVVDFNYLDARGREKVAQALESIAAEAEQGGETYKIYGLTRQTRLLTPGFTKAPLDLQRAAQAVRETAFSRKPASPPGAENNGRSDIPGEGRRTDMVQMDITTPTTTLGKGNLGDVNALAYEADMTYFGDARTDYDPGASLAALEGIMRAHTYLPGRKAIVLFSSEAFRFAREERLLFEVQPIREMARFGYSLWTVDVEGIGRVETGASELLSQLAQDTGGRSVRQTGELAQAFAGAAEQLSCYYLFSLPVPRDPGASRTYQLDVRLDTSAYPDLWGKVVTAPATLAVPDQASLMRGRRLAALLSPGDFPHPPVTTVLEYPRDVEKRPVFTSRFRVPLNALEWNKVSTGEYEARLLVDAVVERDTGRSNEVVCLAGSENIGPLTLRLPAPPRPASRAGLSVELPCVFQKNGLYTARGAITDLATQEAGGGRSTAFINRRGATVWQVWAPRVEAASGKDFLWRPSLPAARLDRERRTTRAVEPGSPADAADRLLLRHVLCGPDPQAAQQAVRYLLVRRGEAEPVLATFGPETLQLDGGEGQGAFCAPATLAFPEFSIPPGEYAILILGPGARPLASYPPGAEGEGILGRVEFGVAPLGPGS